MFRQLYKSKLVFNTNLIATNQAQIWDKRSIYKKVASISLVTGFALVYSTKVRSKTENSNKSKNIDKQSKAIDSESKDVDTQSYFNRFTSVLSSVPNIFASKKIAAEGKPESGSTSSMFDLGFEKMQKDVLAFVETYVNEAIGIGNKTKVEVKKAEENVSQLVDKLEEIPNQVKTAFDDVYANLSKKKWADFDLQSSFPNPSALMNQIVDKAVSNLIGSLVQSSDAGNILERAKNPQYNPEVNQEAHVRIGPETPDAEKEFVKLRLERMKDSFADFIEVDRSLVDVRDIPIIAIAGSGGGYRAMLNTLGSLIGAKECGLFDNVTYLAGVSGSCWSINGYFTAGQLDFDRLKSHFQSRLSTSPTDLNAFLEVTKSKEAAEPILSGLVRKFYAETPLSLVDVFGTLLSSRLLVQEKVSGVNLEQSLDWSQLKLSNQTNLIQDGSQPMPIYTAVRHDIREASKGKDPTESGQKELVSTHQFQWFEFTPFEVGSSEFEAWIPTWGLGRKFDKGVSLEKTAEMESSLYLGLFGSAFCATIAHIADEVKGVLPNPLNGWYENLSQQYHDDLVTIHPITPTNFNNPYHNLDLTSNLVHKDSKVDSGAPDSKAAEETAQALEKAPLIALMDAGMDNNLPLYPLLRTHREVDVIVALDASDAIRTTTWFAKADAYCSTNRQPRWRGLGDIWKDSNPDLPFTDFHLTASNPSDPQLTQVELGVPPIHVLYLPLQKAIVEAEGTKGFDPATADFTSTFNFKYTPKQTDQLITLAQSNFQYAVPDIQRTLKLVWENKRKARLASS